MSGFLNILLAGGGATIQPAPELPDLSAITLTYQGLFGQDAGETELDELVGLDFSPDGLKMWIHQDFHSANPQIVAYDLNPAWDITSAIFNSASAKTNNYSLADRFQDFQWNNDGTSIYFTSFNISKISRIDVATPYTPDWSAIPTVDQEFVTSGSLQVGLHMFNDGSQYFIQSSNGVIRRYTMSTPWDLTTSVFQTSGVVSGQDVVVSKNGLRVWTTGPASPEKISQWDITTPFDMSEFSGPADVTFTLQNAASFTNAKVLFVPIGRNEVYVGWYGTLPAITFIEKYTW